MPASIHEWNRLRTIPIRWIRPVHESCASRAADPAGAVETPALPAFERVSRPAFTLRRRVDRTPVRPAPRLRSSMVTAPVGQPQGARCQRDPPAADTARTEGTRDGHAMLLKRRAHAHVRHPHPHGRFRATFFARDAAPSAGRSCDAAGSAGRCLARTRVSARPLTRARARVASLSCATGRVAVSLYRLERLAGTSRGRTNFCAPGVGPHPAGGDRTPSRYTKVEDQ